MIKDNHNTKADLMIELKTLVKLYRNLATGLFRLV
jgi:hypothetical protein